MRPSRLISLLSMCLVAACFDLPSGPASGADEAFIFLGPSEVGLEEPVWVEASQPLSVAPAIGVRFRDEVVAFEARVDGAKIMVSPRVQWPSGGLVEVVLELSEGAQRSAKTVVIGRFSVRTSEADTPLGLTLLGPLDGPANLRWLLLSGSRASFEEAEPLALLGQGGPRTLERHSGGEGRALFRLAPPAVPCGEACDYGLVSTAADLQIGRVRTSSAVDVTPPVIAWVDAAVRGASAQITVFADEPVVALGALRARDGGEVPLELPSLVGTDVILTPAASLEPSTDYQVLLSVEDLAGNVADAPDAWIRTADVPSVEILEVVAAPLRDWGDSDGLGVPFDAWPGEGAVNDNDEWVEIVNRSDREVDLRWSGLELWVLDGSPSVTPVHAAPGLYFGSGGTVRAWRPGEALVVRPRGSISQRSVRIELWGSGERLDSLTLGHEEGASHPAGAPPDPLHESIARGVDGAWAWCVPTPGDPQRSVRCR